ncbi:hypothetical protein PL2TA16_05253 [Pseudoalteromonas luteoviolacea 2ta16]|uniref:Uncharacterized protein n=1 Tax=Pseudoalteromonas luteoviolacea (strain 2ta16) TaxID=1353533 RepID=V4HVD0_PSEL2|nr:hypothetical protein PL2TA16_05253 [Pseudoalteromonas luteoviolacea 2ta16]
MPLLSVIDVNVQRRLLNVIGTLTSSHILTSVFL